MNIPIMESIDLNRIIEKYGLGQWTLVNLSVGWDDGIYLLYSAHVPERIQGMFVDTVADTEYRAICLWVDWQDGGLLGEELLEFGRQKMNFHFIQPIGDHILLLGARTRLHRNGIPEQNAVFLTRGGKVLSRTCFGDGIQDCLVMEDGRIVTSYFDEGIFGNFGWDQPLGASGLVVWDEQGRVLWKNTTHAMIDCYAMNIDEQNNLWFYYYNEFLLVKTDFTSEWVYQPKLSGSSSLLIMKSHTGIIMDSGYRGHSKLKMLRLLGDRLGKISDVEFTWEGHRIPLDLYCFRSSKAVIADGKGKIYCVDVI